MFTANGTQGGGGETRPGHIEVQLGNPTSEVQSFARGRSRLRQPHSPRGPRTAAAWRRYKRIGPTRLCHRKTTTKGMRMIATELHCTRLHCTHYNGLCFTMPSKTSLHCWGTGCSLSLSWDPLSVQGKATSTPAALLHRLYTTSGSCANFFIPSAVDGQPRILPLPRHIRFPP